MSTIHCDKCGAECKGNGITTGYGTIRNPDGTESRHCYACCGEADRLDMIATGRAVLYLTIEGNGKVRQGEYRRARVSNWPGSLEFQTSAVDVGRHNIARTRYDVRFTGPDGKRWHGVTYGDNTQICHCKRLKSAA